MKIQVRRLAIVLAIAGPLAVADTKASWAKVSHVPAIEDLPDNVHTTVHICQGNYAVGPDYDGQIGHRYFDAD